MMEAYASFGAASFGSLLFSAFLVVLISVALAMFVGLTSEVGYESLCWVGGFWVLIILAYFTMSGLGPRFPDAIYYSEVVEGLRQPKKAIDLRLFHVFSSIPNFLAGRNIYSYLVVQICFFWVGVLFFAKGFELWMESKEVELSGLFYFILVILFVSYPATFLFSVIPLREAFIVSAFGILFYGAVSLHLEKFRAVPIILISGIMIFFVRVDYLALALPLLVLFLPPRKFLKKVFYFPFIVLSLLGFLAVMDISLSPESLAQFRNARVGTSELSYGVVDWGEWLDVVVSVPLLVFQFWLSPIAIIGNWTAEDHLSFIITLFFEFFIVFTCLRNFSIFGRLLLFFLIGMVVLGMFEVHAGAAVRHRSVLYYFLLPCSALTIYNFSNWLLQKK